MYISMTFAIKQMYILILSGRNDFPDSFPFAGSRFQNANIDDRFFSKTALDRVRCEFLARVVDFRSRL